MRLLAFAAMLCLAGPALADNPHDGYMQWMPCGVLVEHDAASARAFHYQADGRSDAFTVHPRRTRFDVPRGQIVLVTTSIKPGTREAKVEGQSIGKLGLVTFLPVALTQGKADVRVEIAGSQTKAGQPSAPFKVRVYYTNDAWRLGRTLDGNLADIHAEPGDAVSLLYRDGVIRFFEGQLAKARGCFRVGEGEASQKAEVARLFARFDRWVGATSEAQRVRTGPGCYRLGLYCMVNGFWELAAESFRRAAALMPRNPDAWYMLADALSYRDSDLDQNMARIVPYYRKAADLYPRTNSNTYRNFVGFFRKFRVKDGDKETVLTMTDEQMARARKTWEWCSAILEAASRGSLRMVNTYRVFDREFDNTRHFDPRPFEGLFQRGTVDAFMKMAGWGASDCLGHDCGPSRSAPINIGIREWDVMLHEWNHSLDWAMLCDELGVGVPVTHSSDWCGFQPIPSMGMGHHSCNRYYMTPGMYRFVRGSDPATTPYVDEWIVSPPKELLAAVEKPDDAFTQNVRAAVEAVKPPAKVVGMRPWNIGGYMDLRQTWATQTLPANAYAFAQTYVFTPKQQKVRMWLGADDNVRAWLNGRLVHKGLYWAVVNFQEAREKDQIATGIVLRKGWNRLVLQVTNAQHGEDWIVAGVRSDQWGFSVRFCDIHNQAVPGLKWRAAMPEGYTEPAAPALTPKRPRTYSWETVRDDYTTLLPELSLADLRAITGYPTLAATDDVLLDLSEEPAAAKLQPIATSDPKSVRFDNLLNWYFSPKELSAVVRYRRGAQTRDLLLLCPEAYEAFFALLPVTPEAAAIGIKRHADQAIGYFLTKREDSPNGRIVLVVDTYLGAHLPRDEEDLLSIAGLK